MKGAIVCKGRQRYYAIVNCNYDKDDQFCGQKLAKPYCSPADRVWKEGISRLFVEFCQERIASNKRAVMTSKTGESIIAKIKRPVTADGSNALPMMFVMAYDARAAIAMTPMTRFERKSLRISCLHIVPTCSAWLGKHLLDII